MSKILESARNRPTLQEQGIVMGDFSSLPFHDVIGYTSPEIAFQNYLNDPYGERKLQFLKDAYGISNPSQFFKDAGLELYVEQKKRRAMMGAIKSHTLQATPYNLMNDAAFCAAVQQKYDVPTAVLVVTHEGDIMHTSPEKMEAFGKQRYFVGYDNRGRAQYASVHIRPTGLRGQNGVVTPISVIDEACGHPLRDIFVSIDEPTDPKGKRTAYLDSEGTYRELMEMATGISWKEILTDPEIAQQNEGYVSVTQLHKYLFRRTVRRLRDQGYFPSENDMPFIESDLAGISDALFYHARPSQNTLEILGFAGKPQQILSELLCMKPGAISAVLSQSANAHDLVMQHHDDLNESSKRVIKSLPDDSADAVLQEVMQVMGLSFDKTTGLLRRGQLADAASYYPFFSSLLDVDFTSLNEPSSFFTRKIQRTQALLQAHGLPNSYVKVPHEDVHGFDTDRLHPTGQYFDYTQVHADSFARTAGRMKEKTSNEDLVLLKAEYVRRIVQSFQGGLPDANEYRRQTEALAVDPVMAWFASMVANLPDQL